jgi:hypothetical protein
MVPSLWPARPPDCALFERTFLPADTLANPLAKGGESHPMPNPRPPVQNAAPVPSGAGKQGGAGMPGPGPSSTVAPEEFDRTLRSVTSGLRPLSVGLDDFKLAGLKSRAGAEILTMRIAYVLALIEARMPSIWRDRPATLNAEDLCRDAAPFHIQDFQRFLHAPAAERIHDPLGPFLNIQRDHFAVEVDTVSIAAFERLLQLTVELSKGGGSGISSLEVNLVKRALNSARAETIRAESDYRASLENLKDRLGLAGRPIIPDVHLFEPHRRVRRSIENWASRPNRDDNELKVLVARLPDMNETLSQGRLGRSESGLVETAPSPGRLKTIRSLNEQAKVDLVNAVSLRGQLYNAIIATPHAEGDPGASQMVSYFILTGTETEIGRIWKSIASLWCEYQLEKVAVEFSRPSPSYVGWEPYFESIEGLPVHSEPLKPTVGPSPQLGTTSEPVPPPLPRAPQPDFKPDP